MNKNPKLPKEALEPDGARNDVKNDPSFVDSGDVEGHGLPLTPPPGFGPQRTPGHGGENIPSPVDDEDDVEGHAL